MSIINSWPLRTFKKEHENRLRIGNFVNKETAEEFKSLIFGEENLCFVAFSSKLGVLTREELKSRADELQVVQLDSGTYSLCKKGESQWEEVDL